MEERQIRWIKKEMEGARKKGLKVEIDGVRYNNEESEHLYEVFEDMPYMMDYEGDENGRIVGVSFYKISQV